MGTGFVLDRTVLDPSHTDVVADGTIRPASEADPASTGPEGAPGDGSAPSGAPSPATSAPETGYPVLPLKRMRGSARPDPGSTGRRPAAQPAAPGQGGGSGTSGGTGASARAVAAETEVLRLTNAERAKAGCTALRMDSRLRTAARSHSKDMSAHRNMSHTGSDGSTFVDRIARTGYTAAGAENVAMGYQTPAAVMQGWMNSSGHRANILNCKLRAIGVGVDFQNGGPWWTQNFGWA